MTTSSKKEVLVMVLRPTIFKVEAKSFEDAKRMIDQLIASGQMKPSAPIEFREIVDYKLKEEENKQEEQSNDNGSGSGDNSATADSQRQS